MGVLSNEPRTVTDVFKDYKGRRASLRKALTTDADKIYKECDPDKDNLCLFGYPSGEWVVTTPGEEVPSELPEPAIGINFAREMARDHWLSFVAMHSDCWLIAVALCHATKCGFDKKGRRILFDRINKLPTLFEVVTRKLAKEKNIAEEVDTINEVLKDEEEEAEKVEDDDDETIGLRADEEKVQQRKKIESCAKLGRERALNAVRYRGSVLV